MSDGFAVVDKAAGPTSHDVVALARRRFGTRKVGHAGTLDPDATGVLILGVGRATRLLQFLTGLDKSYEAEIQFGVETSTLDAAGEVTATHDMGTLDPEAVRAAAATFLGHIEQVPPMVSAIKVDGRRLHELAREGKEVDRPPRPVHVARFDVEPVDIDAGRWRTRIDCSSGTYIRSLVADLGAALGGGAHLLTLRRTAVGPFTLDQAAPLDDVVIRPPADGLSHMPQVRVSDDVATSVHHGRVLRPEQLGVDGDGPWVVLDGGGAVLAVYGSHKETFVKPVMVLASEPTSDDAAGRA
jgi:tRNA pseudouridine55 synthase